MSLSEQNRALLDEADDFAERMTSQPWACELIERLAAALRAEGVAALQQAGEHVADVGKLIVQPAEGWVLVPREPTEAMTLAGSLAWEHAITWDAATDHPALAEHIYRAMTSLPQQTALVEEGVEKIIGPHEPAACGASAPSEAPRSSGPIVYLRDAGGRAFDGEWDECWVPCSKGDPGAVAFSQSSGGEG